VVQHYAWFVQGLWITNPIDPARPILKQTVENGGSTTPLTAFKANFCRCGGGTPLRLREHASCMWKIDGLESDLRVRRANGGTTCLAASLNHVLNSIDRYFFVNSTAVPDGEGVTLGDI
jgi:hypothetical protein